jgi:hypothetical protein
MPEWKPFTDANPVYMTLYDEPEAEVKRASELMDFLVNTVLEKNYES